MLFDQNRKMVRNIQSDILHVILFNLISHIDNVAILAGLVWFQVYKAGLTIFLAKSQDCRIFVTIRFVFPKTNKCQFVMHLTYLV